MKHEKSVPKSKQKLRSEGHREKATAKSKEEILREKLLDTTKETVEKMELIKQLEPRNKDLSADIAMKIIPKFALPS